MLEVFVMVPLLVDLASPRIGTGSSLTLLWVFLGISVAHGLFANLYVQRRMNLILMNPRKHTKPGYCVSCWYDLGGLVPERDGCTICPECGAAWKLKT